MRTGSVMTRSLGDLAGGRKVPPRICPGCGADHGHGFDYDYDYDYDHGHDHDHD